MNETWIFAVYFSMLLPVLLSEHNREPEEERCDTE